MRYDESIFIFNSEQMVVKKDDKKKDDKNASQLGEVSTESVSLDLDTDIIPDDSDEEIVIEVKKKEISQAGYNKLVAELKELEDISLPDVNERIKEAREYGDLSENAEYNSAVNEKQMVETRIAELKEIIGNSIVVDIAKKGNTVQYGSVVTFEIPEWEETYTVTIIGTAEITFEEEVKHISLDSPIGMAMEGKRVGDICRVRSERGRFDLKILKVE